MRTLRSTRDVMTQLHTDRARCWTSAVRSTHTCYIKTRYINKKSHIAHFTLKVSWYCLDAGNLRGHQNSFTYMCSLPESDDCYINLHHKYSFRFLFMFTRFVLICYNVKWECSVLFSIKVGFSVWVHWSRSE